ncbi:hypothetical protein EON81_02445 [bacterium]|nr:MAG: hypothetical protein EON81_02445 [bacterium]
MRSGVTKKRRKRVLIEWRPILWILLLGNIAFGLSYSRVTRLTRISVEGATQGDQGRLKEILGSMHDVPCLRINPRNIEALALDHPAVRTVELTRNIFGSGRLKVVYRTPVAERFGRPGEALSADGMLYRAIEVPEGLPKIQMPNDYPTPSLALAGGWRGESVAWLAQEASALSGNGDVRIGFARKGTMTLYLGGGKVELGGPTRLERKMEVLRTRLNRDPGELQRVESLVLTDPESPVFVRRPEQPSDSAESTP